MNGSLICLLFFDKQERKLIPSINCNNTYKRATSQQKDNSLLPRIHLLEVCSFPSPSQAPLFRLPTRLVGKIFLQIDY